MDYQRPQPYRARGGPSRGRENCGSDALCRDGWGEGCWRNERTRFTTKIYSTAPEDVKTTFTCTKSWDGLSIRWGRGGEKEHWYKDMNDRGTRMGGEGAGYITTGLPPSMCCLLAVRSGRWRKERCKPPTAASDRGTTTGDESSHLTNTRGTMKKTDRDADRGERLTGKQRRRDATSRDTPRDGYNHQQRRTVGSQSPGAEADEDDG